MKLKRPFWGEKTIMRAYDSLGLAAMHPSILCEVIRVLRAILRVMLFILLLNPMISQASQSDENQQWNLD